MSNLYVFEKPIANQHILEDVIKSQSFSNIETIGSVGNEVTIAFSADITEQDRASLSNIVWNFDDGLYNQNETYKIENIGLKLGTIQGTTWRIPSEFVAKGKYLDTIKKIGVNAYISSATNGDTYDVRIYDALRNTVCGLATFSNHTAETNEIPVEDENMPATLSPLEVQIRCSTSETIVTVNSVCTFSLM